jgi:acetyl esterase
MPLDKQAAAFIKQLEAIGGPALNEMPPAAAREAAAGLGELGGGPESVASIVNRTIAGPLGDIPIRIYTPEGSSQFPVVVYFHGGGWVIGNPDTVDATCRMLANHASAVVVSVDYRLAPEQKFPAAVADCYATTQWVAENAGALGGDPQRIAVAGDSAGGNLAAVIALLARDRGTPKLAFQVLFYPVTDHNLTTASYLENGKGYFLTHDMMKWFWDHYLNNDDDGRDWQASPLRAADKRGLPPAFVATAEFDPLRDEGEAYAEQLRLAGNTVTAKRYEGQIHGFVTLLGAMDQGKQAIEDAAAVLRQAFGVKSQV